ncbi:hypothetical protein [Gynurincola endophyticus]|uniref:hypothetical protein n=1 Tax=Gynurincola endophyticus TaxID=2479004 RepID=UPI000F8D2148|nr:hypothetical protein [Gynurincola endophyticus]
MLRKLISLHYKKMIDSTHQGRWEKMVLEQAYEEFKLQFQYYNREQLYHSYSEIKTTVHGADQLPYLVSGAIFNSLHLLEDIIPDIYDQSGEKILTFKQFSFELLTADIRTIDTFRIVINFFSEPVLWLETIGEKVLLSKEIEKKNDYQTALVTLLPYLSVYRLTYQQDEL